MHGHVMRSEEEEQDCMVTLKIVLEGRIGGKRTRSRLRIGMIDNFVEVTCMPK